MAVESASNDDLEADPSDWTKSTRRNSPSLHTHDNTEGTGNTHKVLLKISIPDNIGIKINQMVDIRAVLTKLFDTNHDKLISNDKKYQICNMQDFPRNQSQFEEFFH